MSTKTLNSKQVNSIYKTTNYSMFKFRKDNRTISEGHVRNLSQKMKEKGWIAGSYAVINERGEIIDGQHRITAAIKANVPVFYTIESKTSFDNIQDLNQGQKNWTKGDHIHGWVIKENENYVTLDRYLKKFPEFKLTEMLMFLNNTSKSVTKEEFENGEFKVRSLNVANQWINNFQKLEPYFEKGYSKSIFVRAMLRVMKKDQFNFDEFLHKVSVRPGMIHMCGTVDQYIEMIETIYNYNRRGGKINLRF
jgi:DNA-binding Lrp family transcriptional regulator